MTLERHTALSDLRHSVTSLLQYGEIQIVYNSLESGISRLTRIVLENFSKRVGFNEYHLQKLNGSIVKLTLGEIDSPINVYYRPDGKRYHRWGLTEEPGNYTLRSMVESRVRALKREL